ncbi:MAG TPA: 4Fe-4S binding protein [bacterium]|nr:4Fe-4S binding protein [bacterium]
MPENRNPFTITADCIACGTCMPECPVDAIREDEIYVIDPAKCIACGKCAEVCPVHACESLDSSS